MRDLLKQRRRGGNEVSRFRSENGQYIGGGGREGRNFSVGSSETMGHRGDLAVKLPEAPWFNILRKGHPQFSFQKQISLPECPGQEKVTMLGGIYVCF